MPTRCKLFLSACLFAVALAASVESEELHYQHKTLTRWLKLYQMAKPGSSEEARSVAAVQAIGTNAVPELLGMLRARDVSQQQAAANGFAILGPAGAAGIPALNRCLNGTNTVAAVLAANALGHIGLPALPVLMNELTNQNYNVATLATLAIVDLGTNAAPAIPRFIDDLESPDHFVRERAADALGNLRLQPEVVVPALTNLLHDHSVAARCLALSALGRFQTNALPAVPLIELLLQHREGTVRLAAATALAEISPDQYKRPVLPQLAE